MARNVTSCVLGAAFAFTSITSAHHPYSATYVADKQITIGGVVVELVYRNPHSFIHVAATDASGDKRRWAVEWGAPGTDRRLGVPTNVLRVGDRLVVTGNPGRDPGAYRILGRNIQRLSDGWSWPGRVP